MTVAEAHRYLRARATLQRTTKTSYNRLRWCKRDLDAVETLLALLDDAAGRLKGGAHDDASDR